MRITTLVIAAALLSLFSSLAPLTGSLAANNQTQAALHRVDFRVEGASCVTCLRRIAKAMRDTKGVLKADVSIYRPYWAIVIYDAKAARFDKLQAEVAKQEKVRFMDIEDKAITEMPALIIPRVGSQTKSAAK